MKTESNQRLFTPFFAMTILLLVSLACGKTVTPSSSIASPDGRFQAQFIAIAALVGFVFLVVVLSSERVQDAIDAWKDQRESQFAERYIAKALAQEEQKSMELLGRALKHKNFYVRSQAAEKLLIRIPTTSKIDSLTTVLNLNEDLGKFRQPMVSKAIDRRLEELGDIGTTPSLVRFRLKKYLDSRIYEMPLVSTIDGLKTEDMLRIADLMSKASQDINSLSKMRDILDRVFTFEFHAEEFHIEKRVEKHTEQRWHSFPPQKGSYTFDRSIDDGEWYDVEVEEEVDTKIIDMPSKISIQCDFTKLEHLLGEAN